MASSTLLIPCLARCKVKPGNTLWRTPGHCGHTCVIFLRDMAHLLGRITQSGVIEKRNHKPK